MLRPSTTIPPREHGPLWRDPRVRAFFLQTVMLIVAVVLVVLLTNNTLSNLAAQGVTTGFNYLSQRSGFGISQTLVDYSANSTYADAFKVGLLNTLLVSVLAIVTCTVLGLLVGLARLSSNWLLSRCATVYIEIFRNIPMLLQLLFWSALTMSCLPELKKSYSLWGLVYLNKKGLVLPWVEFSTSTWPLWLALAMGVVAALIMRNISQYRVRRGKEAWPVNWLSLALILVPLLITFFCSSIQASISVPMLTAFSSRGGIHLIPELVVLWMTLTLYAAAFVAEAVRSGLASVPHGQREAATSLCLPNSLTMRKIVLPQAMRVIIPQLASQYLNVIKNSSLGIAIGYPDLFAVYGITTLNQTGQALEIMATTMAVYLALSLLVSLLMNLINARMALKER